jgi:integrase
MALKINRLSVKTVESTKLAPGLYADGGNLLLQVTPTGSRSWIFRFKRHGKVRDMGLGGFPAVSLATARNLAQDAREAVVAGKDPIGLRDAQRALERIAKANGKTFRGAAGEYLAAHAPSWRNEKHRHQWRQTLDDYAHPVIGDLAVADIGVADVRRVLDAIWTAKPETASRLRGRIEAIINAARADDDSRWSNPARWERHKHTFAKRSKIAPTQHHPALAWKELPALMGKLGASDSITAAALEFVVLTAARSGEVRGATWDEIDLDAKLWTIPGERMKGGKPHVVPLSKRAVAILEAMAAIRLNDYVFPGERRGQPLHDRTLRMFLSELQQGDCTVHGMRSTFKTWCTETTPFPDFLSEMALAHVSGNRVRDAYARGQLLKKRFELMEAWAKHCEGPGKAQPRRSRPRQHAEKLAKPRIRRILPIRAPIPQSADQ